MKKHYLLLLAIILTLNFFLPRWMPGDPFLYLSADAGHTGAAYSQEQIADYMAYYGFDQPLPVQFLRYLQGLVTGDLGYSIYYKTDVADMILARLPWTAFLVLSALAISCAVGTLLGAVSARLRHRALDPVLYLFMVILCEIPSFLMGMLLLIGLAAQLQWFPLSGAVTPFLEHGSFGVWLGDVLHHGALPILTLALAGIGNFYLLSRSSMITVLSRDYLRTAQAKGLSRRRILLRHGLRNALPPIVARLFLCMGTMFGGAVLVEAIFAYPGLGRLLREAVLARDYVLAQGAFLVIAVAVLVMNWLADLVYRRLDPRVGGL